MINMDELHAFVIGFFEVLCPWKPRHSLLITDYPSLKEEYHYYLTGRALGFPTLLLTLIGIAKLGKELLL